MCVQGELQRVFSFGVSRFGRESCLVIFIESHCHVAFEDVIVESGCFDVERLRGHRWMGSGPPEELHAPCEALARITTPPCALPASKTWFPTFLGAGNRIAHARHCRTLLSTRGI